VNARVAWWVMAIVTLLAMGRVVMAARVSGSAQAVVPKSVSGSAYGPLMAALDRQDSLLAAVSVSSRDPFRAWTPTSTTAPVRTAPIVAPPPPLIPPRVVVFMQDGTSTIVQFEVDGDTSPRLPVGGSFRGWTITGISGRSVTLSKDGQQFEVPRP